MKHAHKTVSSPVLGLTGISKQFAVDLSHSCLEKFMELYCEKETTLKTSIQTAWRVVIPSTVNSNFGLTKKQREPMTIIGKKESWWVS